MRLIYHIVPRSAGRARLLPPRRARLPPPGRARLSPGRARLLPSLVGPGPYRAESLATEGFIHCSYRDQVARIANLFYADHADLLLLCIDADRLTCPVRDEDPGTGELFPHVYGPIEHEAIQEVRLLRRGPDGRWVFPEE